MVNLRVECAATQDVISQQHMVADALHALWLETPEPVQRYYFSRGVHPSV